MRCYQIEPLRFESNSETRYFRSKSDLFHLCRQCWLLSELKNDPKMWMKVTATKVLFAKELDVETTSNVMSRTRFTFFKRIVSACEIDLRRVIKRRNRFEMVFTGKTMFWDVTRALTGFEVCFNKWNCCEMWTRGIC